MEQVWNRYGTDGTQNVIHTHQQTLIHTPHKFGAINKSPLAAFTEAAIYITFNFLSKMTGRTWPQTPQNDRPDLSKMTGRT